MEVVRILVSEKERRKWYIRITSDGIDIRNVYEGTLEEARKYAEEWARRGNWSKPVVEVRVELWDGDPETGANIVEGWYQYSYDTSKLDPYREAEYKYRTEYGAHAGRCPTCGRVGPKVRTPGLGGMDKYLEWREMEPHAFLAWCECSVCGRVWNCVDENYVFNVAVGMWVKYGHDYLLKI